MADTIYRAIPTEVGITKIQQAMWTKTKLQLVTLAYGDGVLDINNMHKRTTLVHQLGMVQIDAAIMDLDEHVTWITAVIGAQLPSGTIREIGLIDEDGDLCFIGNTPEIDKVDVTEGTLVDVPIEFGIKNTYSEFIEIPFDPSGNYATREWVNANYALRNLSNITQAGATVIKNIAFGPILYNVYEDNVEIDFPFDPYEDIISEAEWEEIGWVPPDNPDHEVRNPWIA